MPEKYRHLLDAISTNDVYYKRQLSMLHRGYTIHSLRNHEAVFYCYPQVNAKKGSNEVASFLFHFVCNFAGSEVKHLHLFSDSCGGQTKYFNFIRVLHYIQYEAKLFESVTITFPIRGHSYMDCDRDMSIINLKTKMEIPNDFYQLIREARQKPSHFQVVEVDNSDIQNWSKFVERFYVKKCIFKTQPIREMKFYQESRLVQYRNNYHSHWQTAAIRLPDNKLLKNPMVAKGQFELPKQAYEGLIPLENKKFKDLEHNEILWSTGA